jgi:hypothetical protein
MPLPRPGDIPMSEREPTPRLSVVIPTYNKEERIAAILETVAAYLASTGARTGPPRRPARPGRGGPG